MLTRGLVGQALLFFKSEKEHSMEIINNIIYYLVVSIEILLGLTVVGSLIAWVVFGQINNIELKRKAVMIFFVATMIFYIMRFGSIIIISALADTANHQVGSSTFISVFRLLQLFIIAFVPTFVIPQSYIFEYQYMLTERIESKQSKRMYLIYSFALTSILVLLLELLLNLF